MGKVDVCSFKFNNQVVGFFPNSEKSAIIQELKDDSGLYEDSVRVLTSQEAEQVIAPFGEDCGPFTQIRRFFQRAIGGGVPEFLRDVSLASGNRDRCLICVLVEDEVTKDKVAEVMRRHGGKGIKYFHPMYVEHLTLERGHGQDSFLEEAVGEDAKAGAKRLGPSESL